MLTILTIAVIILAIVVVGLIIYLWWFPIKVKELIKENDEMNNAMELDEETNFEEEEEADD